MNFGEVVLLAFIATSIGWWGGWCWRGKANGE